MDISDKIVKNIIGTKKNIKDTDGDGVADNKDCQPNNTMRQDRITTQGLQRLQFNLSNRGNGQVQRIKNNNIRSKI